MIIEVEALHTDFNGRLALLDSEINTVSFTTKTKFEKKKTKPTFCFFYFSFEIDMKNVNMILNKQLKIVMQCQINSNQYLIVCYENFLFLYSIINLLELHDLERQVPDLRKKADDERAKKEAVCHLLF